MNRFLWTSGLCAALVACGGSANEAEVDELQAFLRDATAQAPPALERLRGSFARQAVRARGYAAQGEAQAADAWSPVVARSGDALSAADVTRWVKDGVIDAAGRFAPGEPRFALALTEIPDAFRNLPAVEIRAARLAGAVGALDERLERLEWAPGDEHGVRLDAGIARVNPRLLLFVFVDGATAVALPARPDVQPGAPGSDSKDRGSRVADTASGIAGPGDEPGTPSLPFGSTTWESCTSSCCGTGSSGSYCGGRWCASGSTTGATPPMPLAALFLVPSALAWSLARRRP